MLKRLRQSGLTLAAAGAMALVCAGCESNTATGALMGGAGGAALGGLIGSYSHARAGEGALIGGAIGAASGALVGHAIDDADRDREASYYRDRYYGDAGYGAPPPPPSGYVPSERYEYRTYDDGYGRPYYGSCPPPRYTVIRRYRTYDDCD